MIFRGAYCDFDHCLVVAEGRGRLALSKLGHRSLRWKDLISGSYVSWRLGNSIIF
jgi:hypothetical protein